MEYTERCLSLRMPRQSDSIHFELTPFTVAWGECYGRGAPTYAETTYVFLPLNLIQNI